MENRKKFVDFIEEFLYTNDHNKEEVFRIKKDYYISQDLRVTFMRKDILSNKITEWRFIGTYKEANKTKILDAFVYDIDKNPKMIWLYDSKVTNLMKIIRTKRRKEIDNHKYFQRGSYLIELL